MHSRSKNQLLLALVLLALLLIGGLFLFKGDSDRSTNGEESAEVEGDETTVNGTIACLPYHVNIAGQGCVKGIRGDDGKIYALNSPRGLENTMSEGTKVTAKGVYQPADTSVDDASVFRYDGVLVVRSLIRR